jgi:hypothetical protein
MGSVVPILNQVATLLRCAVRRPSLEMPVISTGAGTSVAAAPGTKLGTLVRTIHQLAERTGASERSLVAFVLCGLPPVVPRWQVRTVVGTDPLAVVTLRGRDVSAAEFRTLHRRIRTDLGVTRLKATTAGQLDLVALVDELGGARRVRGTTRVSGRLLGQGSPSVEPSSPRPPV